MWRACTSALPNSDYRGWCVSAAYDLHTLHRWSKSWKMAFNGKKCHFTRNRNTTSCSYTLGQDKLTPVSHHPYLGVELDDHLNWKEQTERARSKGVRMLNMVRRNFTHGTTPTIRCEIYKSLVRPSMEYGRIVWDPHQQTRIKTLEAVQNKGARYVNQDWDRYKSVTTMKKDLGWLTLQERRLVNRLTFLMKSIHNIHGHTLPPSACLTYLTHWVVHQPSSQDSRIQVFVHTQKHQGLE